MEYLVALLPIISILFFMVILEKPAYIAGPISLALTIALSVFYIKMDASWIGASLARGSMLSLDIMLIIAGVFLLVAVLKKSNAFYVLRVLTHRVSSDGRIQLIFLAWFVIAFLEGVAGFGTPAMIVVPILIALGFSPLSSVAAALIGDSVVCTFGAAGTPILIGIAGGVAPQQIELLGPDFLAKVASQTAFLHLLVGFLVPFFMLCIVSYIEEGNIRMALKSWKLAAVSGILLLAPSYFINYFLGPEFPSIVGSLAGMLIFIWMINRGAFVPKDKWIVEKDEDFLKLKDKKSDLGYGKALFPYIVAVALLVLTRMNVSGLGDFLKTIKLSFHDLYGTTLGYDLYPLYSPGFFFMIAAILAFYVHGMSDRSAENVVKAASAKIVKTFVALLSILSLVQVMANSDHNISGHLGFLGQVAELFTETGVFWPFFSPFLGLFGAFLVGSSTVSNLIFSSVQVDTALALGMSPILALSLQAVGSALGNMFAIHNIVAAAVVAHLTHPEGRVMKHTVIPALIICALVGIFALVSVSL